MAIIVGVRYKNSGKTYYFDPKGQQYNEGDGVVCDTARGQEYGVVSTANKEVPDKSIVQPLRPILRKATYEDEVRHAENLQKKAYLVKTTQEKVAKHNLNMKIVDAEYTFDRQKVVVYFTAEGRVDFRELVKDLASVFHVRIELRQIYERDDIKMRGALATCGRPCCCTTFLNDFEKVSIKMAKVQGLSLNPQKISGCCGKLMCCLKYENPYYQEVFKKMPKMNSSVNTPDGKGLVAGHDMLRQEVKVKFLSEDGSQEIKSYPLDKISGGKMQKPEEVTDEPDETDE
ncbi:MAG: stage 0 sporulation family protein [Clostridia bacterium]|nr:stage 0 sporulation family protein [Clostridia bacterium]